MSFTPPHNTFKSRLSALARKFGLAERGRHQIFQRASQLRLPFAPIPGIKPSICWNSDPQLHRLVELPRGALSGPVQEDKSDAHALLINLIKKEEVQLPKFDLRTIDGLSNCTDTQAAFASLEALASSEGCRKIRIISYKDLVRTLSLAVPGYLTGDCITLRQASWMGGRIYWAGEQNNDALACAIAYMRLRELEITLPATLHRYELCSQGLLALQQNYYVVAIPKPAWTAPEFMELLLDTGLPYARLSLITSDASSEILMLPKHSADSSALGEGLITAGAADVVAYLLNLNMR